MLVTKIVKPQLVGQFDEMFVLTLKTFFFIILCLVFFKLFGIESIEKFFAQQTFVVSEHTTEQITQV